MSIVGIFLIISSIVSHSMVGILQQLSRNEKGEYPYSFITVICYVEFTKLLVSFSIFKVMKCQSKTNYYSLRLKDILLWSTPAFFYSLSNNIHFLAIKYLNSSMSAQVLANLEIVVVGVGSYLFLKKKLEKIQWISLLLLTVGVVSAQISSCPQCTKISDYPLSGSLFAMISGITAGIGGLLIEYLMKNKENMSLWQQNCYNYSFGTVANILALFMYEKNHIKELFNVNNFSVYTALLLFLYVYMGLITSAILKHLNNIIKVFATGSSLFLTAILSSLIFKLELTIPFILSLVNVSVAIYLYKTGSDTNQYTRLPEQNIEPQKSPTSPTPTEPLPLI